MYCTCMTFGYTLRKPTTLPTKLATDRRRIPARERIVNQKFTLPVITACKVVTYKRINIDYMKMTSMCQENKVSTGLKPFALYAGLSSTPSYRSGRFAISDSGIKSPSVLNAPQQELGAFSNGVN